MHGQGWWFMGWMWIFWIVVIACLVLFIRWVAVPSRGGGEAQASAEEVLKRRYARGEIGKQEYEQKLNDLRR